MKQKVNTKRYVLANMSKVIVIVFLSIVFACNEDENQWDVPSIEFITTSGYASNDTVLNINDTIVVGVRALTGSDVNLTMLHIEVNNDGEITTIDKGFSDSSLLYEEVIKKGVAESELWSFYVRDKSGRQSETISIEVGKKETSPYGNIIRYQNIVFGAQDNSEKGGFLNINTGDCYNLDSANNHQADIFLLYYYDNVDEDKNTISSPGANINNTIYDLSAWSVNNTTRFSNAISLTDDEFSAAGNDSLILSNSFVFADGKRKAKKLANNNVYAFETDNGRKGLIKVGLVVGKNDGSITCDVIVQQ